MGKIRQGILGGFSGKVANIVGSSWKGIAVMKSLPLSVANPRTTAQVAQRTKFSNVVSTATIFLSFIIKPLWDRFAQRQSGYNAFISANIDLFATAAPDPLPDFKISQGRIGPVAANSAALDVSDNLNILWPTSPLPQNGLNTDLAYCAVFNSTKGEFGRENLQQNTLRDNGGNSMKVPSSWEVGDTVHIYLAFRRADGTEVSDTGYSTMTITAED